MIYIKSCGFIAYKELQDVRLYLVILNSSGEYGFPKGHMEENETEYETAIRELKEETNLEVQIIEGFRHQIEYKFPDKTNVMKQSVYFLGKCIRNDIVRQESEILEAMFVTIETALELLSFEDTKRILKEADAYLSSRYEFRKVAEKDYEFVYQVKKQAYQKYVEENYGSWDEDKQRMYFERFINTYKEGAYIITKNGKDIGFYNGSLISNEQYEVGNICIIPEYQRQGIGSAILRDILAENRDKEIKIQYFKQNPVGKLYDRLGFELCGETAYHYQMVRKGQKYSGLELQD